MGTGEQPVRIILLSINNNRGNTWIRSVMINDGLVLVVHIVLDECHMTVSLDKEFIRNI